VSVSKIKSPLPKAESGLNGLDEIAAELAAAMERGERPKRAVVLIVDVGEIKKEYDTSGDSEMPPGVTVGLRIRRAEALEGHDERLAMRLLVRAWERRHGRVSLPLDTDLSMLPFDLQTASGVRTFRVDTGTGEATEDDDE
jgi:hypothetical protein